MFAEAIEDILRDHCTPAAVRRMALDPSDGDLWQRVVAAGFLGLMQPAERDGAGLALREVRDIIELFGYYAAPLPFADSIAARALVANDADLPDDAIVLAPDIQQNEGTWICPRLPFGVSAHHVLGVSPDRGDPRRLVLLPCAEAEVSEPWLPGSSMVSLTWSAGSRAATELTGDADSVAPMAAALMAAQMAGAMRRIMEMTLEHCNTRQQFGRPLGKFQAVQHQVSVMAEHAAATAMAVATAFHSGEHKPSLMAAAMAKARAAEAVVIVANAAHGMHGAIGVTEEFDLQLYTRRLHEWRLAYGSEGYWQQLVGRHFLTTDMTAAEYVRGMALRA